MENLTRKVQLAELDILEHVAFACEQLGIQYFLAYGTLLGAVRHQGFIPWDDDIDICMKREDYDIFLEKGNQYLPDYLFIQHYSTEPETNNIYIKVRNTNTLFLEDANSEANINHGIFIDIFPIERVPKGMFDGKTEYYRRKIFNYINGCYDLPYIHSIQNFIKRSVALLLHYSICSKTKRVSFIEKEDRRRKILHKKSKKYYSLGYFQYSGIGLYDSLEQNVKLKFENKQFICPANYDDILSKVYGDYMKIPKEEERITHQPLKVLFNLDEENK